MGNKFMKTKLLITPLFVFLIGQFISGQNTILLTKNQSLSYDNIRIDKDSIIIKDNSSIQPVDKKDILCLIPAQGKCFTYKIGNNKTIKITRKFVLNNSEGIGRARLYACKYKGTNPNLSELYQLNADNSITEIEFTNAFKEQRQKMNMANGCAVGSFILSLTLFITTLSRL
jgi:hypothetical protein